MYKYDNEAALTAGSGSRIDKFGAYTGVFTSVEHKEADTGSMGVQFNFESDDGQTAVFYMNTVKKNGDTNPIGHGHINALMRILGVRELEPTDTTIDVKGVKTKAKVFAELHNKPIGIMFNSYSEIYKENETVKLNHAMFYRANDRMSAAEIINKATKAEDADKMQARLKHTPLGNGGAQRQSSSGTGVPDGYVPSDDDIPF